MGYLLHNTKEILHICQEPAAWVSLKLMQSLYHCPKIQTAKLSGGGEDPPCWERSEEPRVCCSLRPNDTAETKWIWIPKPFNHRYMYSFKNCRTSLFRSRDDVVQEKSWVGWRSASRRGVRSQGLGCRVPSQPRCVQPRGPWGPLLFPGSPWELRRWSQILGQGNGGPRVPPKSLRFFILDSLHSLSSWNLP